MLPLPDDVVASAREKDSKTMRQTFGANWWIRDWYSDSFPSKKYRTLLCTRCSVTLSKNETLDFPLFKEKNEAKTTRFLLHNISLCHDKIHNQQAQTARTNSISNSVRGSNLHGITITMAAVTTSNGNDSVSDRQAKALVTLLETFQPRSALKPYLMHLKAIVKDLELVDELPDTVPTCSTATSSEYGKCQQNPSVEEKPSVETGFIEDCDDLEEENDADVIGLMKKLKLSQSFSPQNSIGSTTALHNDGAVYDKYAALDMRVRT